MPYVCTSECAYAGQVLLLIKSKYHNLMADCGYIHQAMCIDPEVHTEGGPISNGVEGGLVPKALTG